MDQEIMEPYKEMDIKEEVIEMSENECEMPPIWIENSYKPSHIIEKLNNDEDQFNCKEIKQEILTDDEEVYSIKINCEINQEKDLKTEIKQEILTDEEIYSNTTDCEIKQKDLKTEIKEEEHCANENDFIESVSKYDSGSNYSPNYFNLIEEAASPLEFERIKLDCVMSLNNSFDTKEDDKKCPYCKSHFFRDRQLRVHIRTVHKEQLGFHCPHCSARFNVETQLLHHFNSRHLKLFSCIFCSRNFSRKCHMINHMKSMHKESFPNDRDNSFKISKLKNDLCNGEGNANFINCGECLQQFFSLKSLIKHYRTNHTILNPFRCIICNLRFGDSVSFQSHNLKTHTGKNKYSCLKCDRIFSKKQCLIQHKRSVHHEIKIHLCSQCDSGFAQKFELREHINSEHKNFKCPECSQFFVKQFQVVNHLATAHSKDKQFHCKECNSYHTSDMDLKLHSMTKHTDQELTCSKCCLCFNDKSNFYNHIKLVHTPSRFSLKRGLQVYIDSVKGKERPYQCPVCARFPFLTFTGLRKHLNFSCHKKRYKCTHCDKSFFQKMELNRHSLIHENKHRCPGCGVVYIDRMRLLNHIRSEHREKLPFFCSHCNMNFDSKISLIQHVRSVYRQNV